MTMRTTSRMLKVTLPACVVALATNAHAAGFPQLDQTWYANQLFWLAITFGLLYFVVSTVIVPSVRGVLVTRATTIDEAIREAEKAKAAAESTKHGIESANADARGVAGATLAKAQSETSKDAADAFSKLDSELARKVSQAEVRINESKDKALGAMKAATTDLAGAMAAKLLGRDVPQADIEAAVAQYMQGGK